MFFPAAAVVFLAAATTVAASNPLTPDKLAADIRTEE